MRDIKFRYWWKFESEVITRIFSINEIEHHSVVEFVCSDDFKPYPITSGKDQFTGLQDKNGADIYEGDLLRIPAKSQFEERTFNCFEVFYHDNECIGGQNIGFCINRMHSQGSSGGGRGYKFTPEAISKHGFVVIGNIHQNKELLK